MSNTIETESVPFIRAEAVPQLVEMFKDSIRRHGGDIAAATALQEKLDESDVKGLSWPECELIISALEMMINDREEAIEVQEAGIAELEGK